MNYPKKQCSKSKYKKRVKPNSKVSEQVLANDNVAQINRSKPFSISFSKVDGDGFIPGSLLMSHIGKFVKFLVGVSKSASFNDFKTNIPMEVKPIKNAGWYKQFYRNVGEDVTLYEVDITDHRCVFYMDTTDKIIYLLNLVKHPENKKNRK